MTAPLEPSQSIQGSQPPVLTRSPAARGWNPFRRAWVQWLTLFAGLVAPIWCVVCYLISPGGPGFVAATFCVIVAAQIYFMVAAFDPGSIPTPSHPSFVFGYFEKLLTLFHGFLALRLGVAFFSEDDLSGAGLIQFLFAGVDMQVLAKIVILVWLWLMAASLYLAGDTHIRGSKRGESLF